MIRPIPFSGDMVRAILDGRKTETRRPVKPKKHMMWEKGKPWWSVVACPYGRPGDILWVRETWAHHPCGGTLCLPPGEGHAWGNPIYRATFGAGIKPVCEGFTPWRPSIHMPRWACRLVLEVVSVRVERLREITEEGARAEGVEAFGGGWPGDNATWRDYQLRTMNGLESARESYAGLWSSIYGKRPGLSWDANPWVWVVGFKVAAVGNEAAQAVMRAAA